MIPFVDKTSVVTFWTLTLFDVRGEGGEPTKRITVRNRQSKVSNLCLFATWDWYDNWDLFQLLEVSIVGSLICPPAVVNAPAAFAS